MNDKLSPLLTGFKKHHNTQHCLLIMLEKWRNNMDNGKLIGVISSIFQKLLIQLIVTYWLQEAYGFSGISLQFLRSYLKNRQQ